MLDVRLLRDDPELVRQTLRERGVRPFSDLGSDDWAGLAVARLCELDRRWLELLREAEQLRRRQKATSEAIQAIGKRPRDEQAAARAPLVEEGRRLREQERELSAQAEKALAERDAAWARVPNLAHPASPRGAADEVLRTVGRPRDFAAEGFSPRDHVAIGEALGLLDFEGGAKVTGQKFYFLRREAVLLDLALQRFALDVAQRHGFVLHTTPDLARVEVLEGLGFSPRGESTQVYSIADSDLCLVGTAEITLGGLHAGDILDEDRLPLLYAGLSHCFRTEAGAHGQESRGLYRVHQFTKVELFAFTVGELAHSEPMHERLLAIEEEIFTALELPYRVVDIRCGDLGGPAYRKYDLEAWMPGRGEWGEVTSTSNCTDYQARRLKVRFRPPAEEGGEGKPRLCHMLNGTAVATSRAIVALLENHQQADGSVVVPAALRPWVGVDRIGPR